MRTNPRLSPDKADWLRANGLRPTRRAVEFLGDPAHKITNAQLYRVMKCWTLPRHHCAHAGRRGLGRFAGHGGTGKYTLAEYHERLKASRS